MSRSSRVRPRPSSFHVGCLRTVFSAFAVARSGERMMTGAFTVPWSDVRTGGRGGTRAGQSAWGRSTLTAARYGGADMSGTLRPSREDLYRTRRKCTSVVEAAAPSGMASDPGVRAGSSSSRSKRGVAAARSRAHEEVRSTEAVSVATTAAAADEEAALVKEVKTLAGFLKRRAELEEFLARDPTPEEWAAAVGISSEDLLRQVNISHRAQERIVACHAWLIVIMARRHHPGIFDRGLPGISRDDVIQEGSIALLRAAETFDPSLGFRFATYAGWWVRDGLQRCHVRQSRIVRLPHHVHAFIRDASKSGMALRRKLGRAPTYDELAAHMGVNVARVRGLSNFKDVFSLDASPFAGAGAGRLNGRRSGVVGVGVNSSGRGSGGSGPQAGSGYQHERLASSVVSPETKAEVCLFRNRLEDLMSSLLSPDELRVVSMRYGLGGGAPTTISELAQKVGASKYIMRKTETRALNKLRRPELSRMDKLGS